MDSKFNLDNDVEVTLEHDGSDLESMLSVVHSNDFLHETELMKVHEDTPPYTIMIYDDLIALGFTNYKSPASVEVKPYSDLNLTEWVDIALSTFQHSARIRDKTTDGSAADKLKFRTDLDWIDFDGDYISEDADKPCNTAKQMVDGPYSKDLYALIEQDGKTTVSYYRINDEFSHFANNFADGIKCELQDRNTYDQPIDVMEQNVREQNPGAVVVKQLLSGCETPAQPTLLTCLPTMFEMVYSVKHEQIKSSKYN